MSDDYQRIEIITGTARRRRWSTSEKLRIVEETLRSGDSISAVARRNGVAPNLLYRWRRLMTEGGAVAVQADDSVTGNGEVRRLEDRVRELERQLGRKTLEVEILKEALAKAQTKNRSGSRCRHSTPVPGEVATVLEVSRSNLIERLQGRTKPCRRYQKAQDAALLPHIRRLVDARPTYGYRRITALLNRERVRENKSPTNHKRIYRIMKVHGLLLEKHTGQRPDRSHDGKVIVMRSNLRWCSDGFEFVCWNGEMVRAAFAIDAHDREIIAWRAMANAGISGSDIRDMMLEAVETRFDAIRAPTPIERLSDNGSPYTARDTRIFATQLNLVPCFTPVASPESNGLCEAFIRTFKRDYLRINPLPDALTVLRQLTGWFEDYNENHPHSGLRMRSPREFIRAHQHADVSA